MSEAAIVRDPFADDVLERLVQSNHDYQRTHGHYIVPLATRLLATRNERDRMGEALLLIRRTIRNSREAPNVLDTIDFVAREAIKNGE